MQYLEGRKKRRFTNLSVLGISVVVAIFAFVSGVIADDTRFGRVVADKIKHTFSDQGSVPRDDNLPEDLDYAAVEEVYDLLRSEYAGDLETHLLIDGLKKGLAQASGDPYTVYLNEEEAKKFASDLNNEFSGIGAEIAIKNRQLQVVAPLPGTPANKAGLRPGDFILAIGEEDSFGMFIDEAVTKIRGPAGSKVVLSIGRSGEVFDVTIERANIEVPNVEGEIKDGNIGYIKINTFGDKVVEEMGPLVNEFQQKNVGGVVLDLRGNGGGRLDMAIKIAGVWLDNDIVLEERGSKNQVMRSGGKGKLFNVPTIVLINKGSASASEIVAGALKDNGVAKVVGETSFGKGSVQSLEPVPGGGKLKVTIARWYTPSGKNIDQEGITPDIEVELSDNDFDNDRDPQLDRALQEIRE